MFDVTVDINPHSNLFGNWIGVTLSDQNAKQIWIPPGYGHAFLVLSEVADFEYKCTDYYVPDDGYGLIWNDREVGIEWPVHDPIVSNNDRQLPTLAELREST